MSKAWFVAAKKSPEAHASPTINWMALNSWRSYMLVLAAFACGPSACASTPAGPPKQLDEARALAPVPACVTVLAGKKTAGMSRSLRDEYWKIVFPAFDQQNHALPAAAVSCTGRPVLDGLEFRGVGLQRRLDEGQITRGGGADGIKAVWLRSHSDGVATAAGALALVRARDDFAYVIGVGAYRGRPNARLALDRLGNELALLVHDDGCTGRMDNDRCDTTLTAYLVRQGRLVEGARLKLEQVDYDASPTHGRLRYHLTASTALVKDTLRVVEHVSVWDASGREIRWAELERTYRVVEDRLEPSDKALWSRVYPPEESKQ